MSVLDDAAVDAIVSHMNADHVDDSLAIVRVLGDLPAASAARMVGLDAQHARFEATVGDATVAVIVPWSSPITSRGQVREELVRMHERATT